MSADAEQGPRTHRDSVEVAASPEAVYDVVADVTRTGEWSPVCRACWWDDEATAGQVGAWFTGRNVLPDRTWETRSQVVAADPGREFAWVVGGNLVRWGYSVAPSAGGTTLTESWDFLDDGIATFHERYGDDAAAQIAQRTRLALEGIPRTLAAIKAVIESGPAASDRAVYETDR